MAYQLPQYQRSRRIALSLLIACAVLAAGCSESPRSGRTSPVKKEQPATATTGGTDKLSGLSVENDTALVNSGGTDKLVGLSVENDTPSADSPATGDTDKLSGPPATGGTDKLAGLSVESKVPLVDSHATKPPASPSTSPKAETPGEHQPADAQNADGTYGKDHIDPVKLNGPIFENWPKPKLALLFSGAQNGYIEPCGCAGLENQKGGLSRRHQLIKRLQADGWPLAAFDAGGMVKRYGRQQELKYAAAVEAIKTMGYDAVTFGGEDLRLSLTELISAVTSVDENQPSPFVATNAALISFDDPLVVPRHQIVEAGGMRFGVLAVLGEAEQRKVNNPEIQFKPAAAAIAEVLPDIQKAQCDKLILLAHTTLNEATELAEKFGQFDYVVTTGGADEPPAQAKKMGQRTQLIEVGHKGMYCVVLGLYDDPKTPQRYQRVPLDARFGESPAIKEVLISYQDQLQALGLAGLRLIPPTGLPKHPQGQDFIGSATCGECHTQAYAVWEKTPHAHATETIVKLSPPRHYDPECLSCHVTGWDPQGYFPYASGYLDLKQKHLHSNGCENCHGPGARHAAAQFGEIDVTDKELKALQLSMRVTKEQAKNNLCVQCHDQDNSPDYNWDTYWPEVEHKGKD